MSACKVVDGLHIHTYMQNNTGKESSVARQPSLTSIVEVENKCTTVYYVYSLHSYTYWCLCSVCVCVLMFLCGGTVYGNNYLCVKTDLSMKNSLSLSL